MKRHLTRPDLRPGSGPAAALLAVVLLLGATACSGSDPGDDSGSGSDATEAPDSEAFFAAMDEANSILDNADDLCEMRDGLYAMEPPPDPTSTEEVHALVDFTTSMSTTAADLTDDPDTAAALRRGAEELGQFAEDGDYSLDILADPDLPIDSAEDYQAALDSLYDDCPDQSPEG